MLQGRLQFFNVVKNDLYSQPRTFAFDAFTIDLPAEGL